MYRVAESVVDRQSLLLLVVVDNNIPVEFHRRVNQTLWEEWEHDDGDGEDSEESIES